MSGNHWSLKSFGFASAAQYAFGGATTYPDGGYKVRTKQFSIKNLDGTASLLYSLGEYNRITGNPDGTTFMLLRPGSSSSLLVNVDRFFVKCNTGDASCQFQAEASLKTGWSND